MGSNYPKIVIILAWTAVTPRQNLSLPGQQLSQRSTVISPHGQQIIPGQSSSLHGQQSISDSNYPCVNFNLSQGSNHQRMAAIYLKRVIFTVWKVHYHPFMDNTWSQDCNHPWMDSIYVQYMYIFLYPWTAISREEAWFVKQLLRML